MDTLDWYALCYILCKTEISVDYKKNESSKCAFRDVLQLLK